MKATLQLSTFLVIQPFSLPGDLLPAPSLTRGPGGGGSLPPSLSAAERPPSDTSMDSRSSRWEKIQSTARSRTLLCDKQTPVKGDVDLDGLFCQIEDLQVERLACFFLDHIITLYLALAHFC